MLVSESEISEKLKRLDDELMKHDGEQFLVTHTFEYDAQVCRGFGAPPMAHFKTVFFLGRIKDSGKLKAASDKATFTNIPMPNLDGYPETDRIRLTNGSYLTKEHYEDVWKKMSGPLDVAVSNLHYWGKEINPTNPDWDRGSEVNGENQSYEIVLGNEKVADYFRYPKVYGYGQPFKMKKKHMDLSYVEALETLRLPVPEDFREAYDEKRNKDIHETIHKLYDLSDGGEKGKVQVQLKQALKLNLHKKDTKVEIRPGLVLYTGEFVRGMCKEYDVKF